MKLPNKTGTVCRLSGKRNRPYMARIYTASGYKILGYYRLKSEAVTAVMQATFKQPPSSTPNVTLDYVYQQWAFKHAPQVTPQTMNSYANAYRIISDFRNRPIRHISATDIEQAVLFANPPRSTREILKTLLKLVYQYAMAHDYADRNIADLVDIRLHDDPEKQLVRKPFTYAEVVDLFSSDHYIAKYVLIGCYSGMRPGELLNLKLSEVDTDSWFFRIHGSKTKSGHFRSIPIHPAIQSIVTELVNKAQNSHSEWICTKRNYKPLTITTLNAFVGKYGHTPHDMRHTFATYAYKSGMDALATKRIMGHVVKDITEAVYTHTDEQYLASQMIKFAII